MKNLHFLPHTHWDREWYRSSDAFRIRLTYSFDMLLDIMSRNSDYKYFAFDGQTGVLDDYLEIRPEKRELVTKLIKEKRIFVGPWYIQPDLYLVSGESVIRNLLIGSNIAKEFGHCMNVGWIPDAFGQIQSTPQIFKDMGMKSMFVWRGFNYRETKDSVFLWKAPNGEEMLTIHFPLGYGHYRYLPNDAELAKQDILKSTDILEKRFSDNELLFMGGSDHARPQEEITSILRDIKSDKFNIEISNPEKYTDAVLESIKKSGRELEVYEGEARSADLGRIHAGITSTKIDYKNEMKKYETLLPMVAEPMSVISSLFGGSYLNNINNYFWKILFKNQFHDSIYCSSPESVNRTAYNRLLNLRHGINETIWLNHRFNRDKIDFSKLTLEQEPILLYNTLPHKRDDYSFVNLFVKDENFKLESFEGEEIFYTKLENLIDINNEIEHYSGLLNLNDIALVKEGKMKHVQIKISNSILPPLGYKALILTYGEGKKAVKESKLKLDAQKNIMENEYLRVEINKDGTLNIENLESGSRYENTHSFEEKGDDGDEYNYSPPVKDRVISTKNCEAKITLLENNENEITYEVEIEIETPAECVDHCRDDKKVKSLIISTVTLYSESRKVEFQTTIMNRAKDHMIRAIFNDVVKSDSSLAEDHFGVAVRKNEILNCGKLEDGATELELPIYPMQRFLKLNSEKSEMVVISGGPCEYEIYNDSEIALTLLRSVGKFGKADLKIRPGRASGYRLDTPSSQLLKDVTSKYALYFDENGDIKDWTRESAMFNVEVNTRHLKDISRAKNSNQPDTFSVLELDERVEMTAFKKSEKGDEIIIRLVNKSDKE
ncbi:MAG: glycoside hydrolase family 38 C-terminal domain-containing protein, partial [Cetobacterium sp.]